MKAVGMRSWLLCLLAAPVVAAHELIYGDIYTFERYIQDYEKHYTTKEYGMRKRLFERRVEEIMAHNSEAVSSYRRGVNDLTDRTDEELEALLGRKHTARSITRSRHYGGAPLRNSDYPEEVDWRKAGVLTPPKNQGHCGSCWTFSGSEAIEAALAISTGKLVNISQQAFLSCTPNGEHCGGKGGCSGATQDILFEWAIENGAYLEDDYPYVSGDGNDTSCQLTDKKPVASIKGFVDVEDNDHDAHMAAIQAQPVSVSVDASKWHLYSSGIMDFDECGPNINHAVLLVGYGTENSTSFWTIRNSWGSKWGEGGYIRLSRSTKCAIDTKPEDGTSCEGAIPADLEVCGTCGVLYSSSYPVGAHWL